jgi:hypothetical protein
MKMKVIVRLFQRERKKKRVKKKKDKKSDALGDGAMSKKTIQEEC